MNIEISNEDVQPAAYQMHCPKCHKLYSVEAQTVRTAKRPLRFQCLACAVRFAVRPLLDADVAPAQNKGLDSVPLKPREGKLVTYALEHLPDQNSNKTNVKAPAVDAAPGEGGPVVSGSKTGAISLAGRHELAELWRHVMENYEDEARHDKFVQACFRAQCLPFASQKYARILAAAPTEELARKMRKCIVGLASFRMEVASSQNPVVFRIPSMNSLILALGSACMTIGLVLPKQKDLVGVGLAAVLLGFGVRYFLRPVR